MTMRKELRTHKRSCSDQSNCRGPCFDEELDDSEAKTLKENLSFNIFYEHKMDEMWWTISEGIPFVMWCWVNPRKKEK